MSAEFRYLGVPYAFTRSFDPSLYDGVDLGPTDFGKRYHAEGLDGFQEAIDNCERGNEVIFDITLSGLGQTASFGPEKKAKGIYLSTIGEQFQNGERRIIGVVFAEIPRKKSPISIAVFKYAGSGVDANWRFHEGMNLADMREWNASDTRHPHSAAARLINLFPPQG
jgi:hypothetical protein